MKNFCFLFFLVFFIPHSNAQWSQTNGPIHGDIVCMDTVGGVIFLGTSDGYVYSSVDNGVVWTWFQPGSVLSLPYAAHVRCMTHKGSELIVGFDVGIFYSNDMGITWYNMTGPIAAPNEMAVHDTSIFVANNYGVYVSNDHGASWISKHITGTPSTCPSYVIAFHDTALFVGTAFGIYRSMDFGTSWTNITGIVPASSVTTIMDNDTTLYSGNLNGMFISTNNGGSWTAINAGLTTTMVSSSATSGNILLAGTNGGGIFLSMNEGASWTAANNGLQSMNIHSIFMKGSLIFAGTDNGVYTSSDTAATWHNTSVGLANNLSSCSIKAVAINSYGVFAGAVNGGVYRSTDKGDSWNVINNGLPSGNIYSECLAATDAVLLAGVNGSVYRSVDNGNNWTSVPSLSSSGYASSFLVDAGTIYLCAANGLYKTTDLGITWTLVNGSIGLNKMIRKGNKMFAYSGVDVLVSLDSGVTFTSIYSGLAFTYVYDIAACGSTFFVGGDAIFGWPIYKTDDDGVTWVELADTNGLPPIGNFNYSLAADSTSIYAGISGSIYSSIDHGEHWTQMGNCSSIPYALTFKDEMIYAGTEQAGVWRSSTNAQVWPGDANHDSIASNFDLLPIGLYYGQSGVARNTISNSWQAYPSINWGSLQSNGSDIKHADCNGDGTIDSNDTLAVNLNTGLVHAIAPPVNAGPRSVPQIFFVSSQSVYYPGDWVDADLWVGDSLNPVSALYGIAFDIGYDASIVQPGTEQLTFPSSWLGTPGTNALKIAATDPLPSVVHGAETRIDHVNSIGYGKIAHLRFHLKNGIAGGNMVSLSINNYSANDSNGNPIYFDPVNTDLPITVGIDEFSLEKAVRVFPNPYSGKTQISYNLETASKVLIEAYDAIGQKIKTLADGEQQSGDHIIGFTSGFGPGIYLIKFNVNGITTTKRVVEMNR